MQTLFGFIMLNKKRSCFLVRIFLFHAALTFSSLLVKILLFQKIILINLLLGNSIFYSYINWKIKLFIVLLMLILYW